MNRSVTRECQPEKARPTQKTTLLTASLGVASFPDDARVPEELLRRADDAMYRVKAERRDGVAAALPQQGAPRDQSLTRGVSS